MKNVSRKWLLVVAAVVVVGVSVVAWVLTRPAPTPLPAGPPVPSLTATEAMSAARAGDVSAATVQMGDTTVDLIVKDKPVTTVMPDPEQQRLVSVLKRHDAQITYLPPETAPPAGFDWKSVLGLLPFAILIPIIIWSVMRVTPGGAAKKAAKKARVSSTPDVTLADVAGMPETVEQMREVVDLISESERYADAGVTVPSGILLEGPPGNGKTLLARAVAGEMHVPFFATSGSDFVNTYVGRGAASVRQLFTEARKAAQKHGCAIIFFDEIDAVGKKRSATGGDGGTQEVENTLNALLVELDGFSSRAKVFVLAATNRADLLDPALTRPGRFGKKIAVTLPDRSGRAEIFRLYLDKRSSKGHVSCSPAFDVEGFASRLLGFSAAEIEELVAEAARTATRRGHSVINVDDFEDALGKVVLGPERTSFVFTDAERELTAWHEAGHAVAAFLLADAEDPVQVTIVPRGFAGGVTWRPPRDNAYPTRKHMFADLVVTMGGRAAEEIVLDGDFSTGPGSDCVNGTATAWKMVTEHGFSRLGPANRTQIVQMSSAIAEKVDEEVNRLLEEALDEARGLFVTHRGLITAVAEELMVRETLHLADIADIAEGLDAAAA